MSETLLKTKVTLPPFRAEQVARPRLIESLNQATTSRLTLISAPAGFGKTTLLGEWAWQASADAHRRIAWLSLDEGDNDAARFWAYVVGALQRLNADFGAQALALLHTSQPASIESAVAALVNELAAIADDVVLILDDYHLITATSVHATLTFLLDHSPGTLRVIISSRGDPPLPLARLRARRDLAEIRADALRFSVDESAQFLNELMGLGLQTQAVAALEQCTEGWIAGLQLAALSIQGRPDPSGFIATFTGGHRFIVDYLAEEVLNRQPPEVRAFLTQTSILKRLSAPLCEAVTQQDNAPAMLTYLERNNLFVIPLDDNRTWYRFHHLFAEALHDQLCRTQPAELPELHRRASEWYARNAFPAEAIHHALAAPDFERAADLIDPACDTLMRQGEVHTIRTWLQALPDDLTRTRPGLCVWYAWAMLNANDTQAAESYLKSAETRLAAAPRCDEYEQTLAGQIAVIRSFAARQRRDSDGAIHHARQALDLLTEEHPNLRNLTIFNLGWVRWSQEDWSGAEQAWIEAHHGVEHSHHPYVQLSIRDSLSHMCLLQGRLHEVAQFCRQALDLAAGRQMQWLAGSAHLRLGEVLREWNQLETAEAHLKESVELSAQKGDWASVQAGHLIWARVKHAQGDAEGALRIIETAEETSVARLVRFTTVQAEIWLARGKASVAERVLGSDIAHDPPDMHIYENLLLARIRIAQGRPGEALELLKRLRDPIESASRLRDLSRLEAWQALAHQALSQWPQARRAIARALSLAEPEGYTRLFLDIGESMARLLARLPSAHPQRPYADRLLAAFRIGAPSNGTATQVSMSTLVDPLHPREVEILQLLATGLSNREVAEHLYLSIGTVRWYVKHIYRKLGVHNRTQAAHYARSLDLL